MVPLPTDTPVDRRLRQAMADSDLARCADPRVVVAMRDLPRHVFVPPERRDEAYDDRALAIGWRQTISQPSLVALMLEHLRIAPGSRVLDVGCGSGYVACLLDRLVGPVGQVFAIERQAGLAAETRERLAAFAPRVRLIVGDGLAGLPAEAPFAAIHVAAACESLPKALVDQLTADGRLVAPIGPHDGGQELLLITLHGDGATTVEDLGAVVFVPALPGVEA